MIELLVRLIEFCQRRAVIVIALSSIITILAGIYAARNLDVNTDTSQMIARDQVWAQQSAVFDAAFPQELNLTTIVIDGTSSDEVADGTAALAAALSKRTDIFHSVRLPDSGAFFNRYGMMFLDPKELNAVSDQIAAAQPLLGPLAADPSLHGLFGVLSQALDGISQGETTGEQLVPPLENFANTIKSVAMPPIQPIDWGSLMTGQNPRPEELRHFIEVQPKLDFASLQPGAAASQVIRDTVRSLHLAEKNLRIRLTGDVPLEDDEFAAVTQGAGKALAITVFLVVIILLLGLRSPRVIVAIVLTVLAGLIITAAFAAVAVGTLNMISIAFAVLFIGIGVDFGIQFSMRFRAELHVVAQETGYPDRSKLNAEALRRTAWAISGPLSVAALATAVGFFSFLPTNYRGVSELGEIAGTSMLIALLINFTLLPALLYLFSGQAVPEEVGFQWAKPIDRWIEARAKWIVPVALLAGLASLALLPSLKFDSDPLDLKDPHMESVKTALELSSDPLTSPAINVLVADFATAKSLSEKLEKLPEVRQVLWLGSLVPQDQDPKLDILGQMQILMGPILDADHPVEAIAPANERQAVEAFAAKLTSFLASKPSPELAGAAQDMLNSLEAFKKMPNAGDVTTLREALLGGLAGRLNVLRESVQAQKITLETMPDDIKSAWIGRNGSVRLQVFPKGSMRDLSQMARFVAAIRANAPNATGAPVAILASGQTVSNAFRTASITAIIAITLTLIVILRRGRDVALVIVPLVLAGLYTIATCVLTGIAFNYANVIAVPLLMGIGVAFDIYFVMTWRKGSGPVALLQSPTARAVLFSAATTTTAFGSLALSNHAGTASMGLLLVLSLFYVVVCTLFVQPALMALAGRGRL